MVLTHFVESYDSIKSDLPIKNVRLEGHALKGFTSSQFFPSDAAHPSKVSAKNRRLELEESPRDSQAISQQGTLYDRRSIEQDKSKETMHHISRYEHRWGFLWRPIARHRDKFLSRLALRTFSDRVSILIFFPITF